MALHNHLALAVLLLTALLIPDAAFIQATNFSYFDLDSSDSFTMIDDVSYLGDNSSFLMNGRAAALLSASCGKLFYKDPVRMKDFASDTVASFQTSFTFQITGVNYYVDQYGSPLHGDGLAFTFGRNSTFTGQDQGASLCLLHGANNGQASNRLFAVEFDTFRNPDYNDSSNNHIGIDVNSMNSTLYYNLCGGSLPNCSYLVNLGYFTAWIDYHSASQTLEVFFANGSMTNNIPKPPKPVINASLPLTTFANLLDEHMYVGFSGSTGAFSEVHQIQSWTFTTTGMPDLPPVQPPVQPPSPAGAPTTSNGSRKVGIIVGASLGTAAALLVLGFFIARCCKRKSYMTQDKFSLVNQNLVPRMFTFKELSKATKNFSRSELLGSGGFGAVYKGTLPSGALVAVKRMRHESKHGEESFRAEAASLSQIRHRNLVQLRGWCHEEEQLFLVYDYMCNGSLDEWLFPNSNRLGNGPKGSNLTQVEALPLGLRYSVLSGVAAALSYLHEECVQCVLHRDIKSSNVLLDASLNAYLGDFGLARLIDHQKLEKTTMMAGTLGYMAPEMPHTGKATKESDVYSFGVLMLEVMCGMRPLDVTSIERGDGVLVDRVWRAHEAGNILQVADLKLGTFPRSDLNSGPYDDFESQEASRIPIHTPDTVLEDQKLITILLHLGLLCCHPNPEDRPSTRLVSQMLQSSENVEMSLSPLPVCKPHANYSRPGFSQFDIAPSSNSDGFSSGVSIQDAVQESSDSTAPSSRSSNGDQPANIQSSFVASSAIYSGR